MFWNSITCSRTIHCSGIEPFFWNSISCHEEGWWRLMVSTYMISVQRSLFLTRTPTWSSVRTRLTSVCVTFHGACTDTPWSWSYDTEPNLPSYDLTLQTGLGDCVGIAVTMHAWYWYWQMTFHFLVELSCCVGVLGFTPNGPRITGGLLGLLWDSIDDQLLSMSRGSLILILCINHIASRKASAFTSKH